MNHEKKDKLSLYLYYIIIGAITFVALAIMPMIGSDFDADMKYPTTTAGWIVFVVTKLCIAFINVILFYSFIQQGKINILDEPEYLQAKGIMDHLSSKMKKNKDSYIPLSPKVWLRKTYLKKGTSIVISSLLGSFALTQAILQYDYATLVSYGITIFFGLVYGVIQMKRSELYWTSEYLEYAKMIEIQYYKEANDASNNREQSL